MTKKELKTAGIVASLSGDYEMARKIQSELDLMNIDFNTDIRLKPGYIPQSN